MGNGEDINQSEIIRLIIDGLKKISFTDAMSALNEYANDANKSKAYHTKSKPFKIEESDYYQFLKRKSKRDSSEVFSPQINFHATPKKIKDSYLLKPKANDAEIVKEMVKSHNHRWTNTPEGDIAVILPNGDVMKVGSIPQRHFNKYPGKIILTVSFVEDSWITKIFLTLYKPMSLQDQRLIDFSLKRIEEAFPFKFIYVDETKGEIGVIRIFKGEPTLIMTRAAGWAFTGWLKNGKSSLVFLHNDFMKSYHEAVNLILHEVGGHIMGAGHHHVTNDTSPHKVIGSLNFRHPTAKSSNLSYCHCVDIISPPNTSLREHVFDYASTLYGINDPYPGAEIVEFIFKNQDTEGKTHKIKYFNKKAKKWDVIINGAYAGTEHVPNAKVVFNFEGINTPREGKVWGVECATAAGSYSSYNCFENTLYQPYSSSNLSLSNATTYGVWKVVGTKYNEKVTGHEQNQIFDLKGGGDHVEGKMSGEKTFIVGEYLGSNNLIDIGRAEWKVQYKFINKKDLYFHRPQLSNDLYILHHNKEILPTSREGYYNIDVYQKSVPVFHQLIIKDYFINGALKNANLKIYDNKNQLVKIDLSKKIIKKGNLDQYLDVMEKVKIPFNKPSSLSRIIELIKNKIMMQFKHRLPHPQFIKFGDDNDHSIAFRMRTQYMIYQKKYNQSVVLDKKTPEIWASMYDRCFIIPEKLNTNFGPKGEVSIPVSLKYLGSGMRQVSFKIVASPSLIH